MSQQVLERPINDDDSPSVRKQYPPLTASDRCDAPLVRMDAGRKVLSTCGAQAFVRAVLPSGRDLLFCGHCVGELNAGNMATSPTNTYYASQRQALIAQGAVLHSEYDKINLKPTESSQPKGF